MSIEINRRAFMATTVLGCLRTRADWLRFFDRDKSEPEDFQVARRPFASDPSREMSVFGCGGVRLPVIKNDQNTIDRELAAKIYDYCYRHGVNYFDTGYNYHNGDSERFLGVTLSRYPRESFFFGDKMPTWYVKTLADAKRIFKEQLERTAPLGYFDIYMLHSLSNPKTFEHVYHKLGVLSFLEDMMADGKIRQIGFSYHGKEDFLEKLLAERKWAMSLIPYSIVESKGEPNRKILAAKKVPVFVMCPLGGGRLAHLNQLARRHLSKYNPDVTPAEWAMRYAASFDGIQTVLSGMARLEHAVENVRTFSVQRFKKLEEKDIAVYRESVELYNKHRPIPCTNCRYCECPYGVMIPEVFAWWNSFKGEGRIPSEDGGANDSQELRRSFLLSYYNSIPVKGRAERCAKCDKCKVGCPQWVFSIPEEMGNIVKTVQRVRDVYRKKGGKLKGKGILPC